MQNNIIDRLFSSFTDLEQAIESAKVTLSKKETVPPEILERLRSYDGILVKQRALASTLCDHINKGNWDEVSRHVGLINGLSAMIRDDARAILTSLSLNTDTKQDDEDMVIC
jgi:hypothetical protein